MPLFSGSNLLAATAVGTTAIVGYAFYFDYKRRNAPGYKDSIRQRRRRNANAPVTDDFDLDITNPTQMQNFFLREISLGEELISSGEIEEGAEHLANAVVCSGQPNQLLNLLQQTLPPEVLAMVATKIPIARERLAGQITRQPRDVADDDQGPIMEEVAEDIEVIKMQDVMVDEDVE